MKAICNTNDDYCYFVFWEPGRINNLVRVVEQETIYDFNGEDYRVDNSYGMIMIDGVEKPVCKGDIVYQLTNSVSTKIGMVQKPLAANWLKATLEAGKIVNYNPSEFED